MEWTFGFPGYALTNKLSGSLNPALRSFGARARNSRRIEFSTKPDKLPCRVAGKCFCAISTSSLSSERFVRFFDPAYPLVVELGLAMSALCAQCACTTITLCVQCGFFVVVSDFVRT